MFTENRNEMVVPNRYLGHFLDFKYSMEEVFVHIFTFTWKSHSDLPYPAFKRNSSLSVYIFCNLNVWLLMRYSPSNCKKSSRLCYKTEVHNKRIRWLITIYFCNYFVLFSATLYSYVLNINFKIHFKFKISLNISCIRLHTKEFLWLLSRRE